jgi:hypothetical protein
MARENEKDAVPFVSFRAEFVAATAPGWRGRPKMQVVIDPRTLLTTDRAIDGLERARKCRCTPSLRFVNSPRDSTAATSPNCGHEAVKGFSLGLSTVPCRERFEK